MVVERSEVKDDSAASSLQQIKFSNVVPRYESSHRDDLLGAFMLPTFIYKENTMNMCQLNIKLLWLQGFVILILL